MIRSLDIRYTLKFTLIWLCNSILQYKDNVKMDGLWKIQVSDDLNILILGYLYCNEYLLYTRAALDTRINKKTKKVLKAE